MAEGDPKTAPRRLLAKILAFASLLLAIIGILAVFRVLPPGFHKPRTYRAIAELAFFFSFMVWLIGCMITNSYFGIRIVPILAIMLAAAGSVLNHIESNQCVGRVPCPSNLRQIGQGLLLYAEDHNGRLPDHLDELMRAADLSPNVLHCPGTVEDPIEPGKGPPPTYLGAGHLLSDFSAEDIVAYCYSKENHDGANVLFGDGHVDWYRDDQFAKLLAENSMRSTTRPAAQTRPAAH
ncbi:MAG TPA: hypothetical protein VHP11_13565 [Tepidisphaeraceae bacterium]|nr:hypothetical protein [Tepidisphaeraceae bacterium]